ncbi:MAG: helix-turn-helix transcriptional regulator [Bacillota bacterium]
MVIGKRITALRSEKGLTQQIVADNIGISRATYAHYEINRREPDNKTLRKLARFFDVSTDYLLELTDLPKPYVLSKDLPAYDRIRTETGHEGLSSADARSLNAALAEFMDKQGIAKGKVNTDFIQDLSPDTLQILIALISQIKKEVTEE